MAEYETVRVEVDLSPEERQEYEAERAIYLEFVRGQGIRNGQPARLERLHHALGAHRRRATRDGVPIAGSASCPSARKPSSTTSNGYSTRTAARRR